MRKLFPRLAGPILTGILLILSQPPFSVTFLAFFALIPLFHSMQNHGTRTNLFMGFIAGTVANLGLVYWVVTAMNRFGGIPIPLSVIILILLVAYLAFYMACFAGTISYLEESSGIPAYLSAPAVWVLLEYIRSYALTGFPWSFLSHSQHKFLPFIQIVSITGTYFLSFLIVAFNGIVYRLWKKRPVSRIYIAVIALLFIVSIVYGTVRLAKKEDTGEAIRQVAIIQGNIRQDVKWDDTFKIETVRKYFQNTRNVTGSANLIIWPETAMPFVFEREPTLKESVMRVSTITGATLVFGTVSMDGNGKFLNSAYFVGPNGKEYGQYHKVHLVPFGEYTPLSRYLPFLEKLTAEGGDFISGVSHMPVDTNIGKIGMLICYEGTFPYITNETVRNGAQVLVNITNDAWFGRSSAPYQHLVFYVFRAIETDRYILRAANTGISAIIDPSGRIRARTELFRDATLKGTFATKTTETIYVRYGDYFIVVVFCWLVLLIFLRKRFSA